MRKKPNIVAKPPKEKVLVLIPKELLGFVDAGIGNGSFEGRSHAVVLGLTMLKNEMIES